MEDVLLTPVKVNSEIICVGISKYNKHYAGKHNDVEKMNNVHATERKKKYLEPVVLKYKISPVHHTFKSYETRQSAISNCDQELREQLNKKL